MHTHIGSMIPAPGGHTCCWHDTPNTLMSYPPQRIQRCCHCGGQRSLRQERDPIPEGHGPYYPDELRPTKWTSNEYVKPSGLRVDAEPSDGPGF